LVAELYVGTAGPNGTLYSGGHGNVISGNPKLTPSGIKTGLLTFAGQKDEDGHPILIEGYTLVVGPSLETDALAIVNATSFEQTAVGGEEDVKLITGNWVRDKVKVEVDPYIDFVADTNAATSWWLFAKEIGGRAALEVDYLAGEEQPALFMKALDQVRLGGGGASGDFATDTTWYKCRHVIGGVAVDPILTAASNGTG
jgi:hypothetical protein